MTLLAARVSDAILDAAFVWLCKRPGAGRLKGSKNRRLLLIEQAVVKGATVQTVGD